MNPLFVAHVVSDFLLQPTWLVRLKERYFKGTLIHTIIHAVVLYLLVLPKTALTLGVVCFVAATHGLIDHIKVTYQKTHDEFGPVFFVDQLAHIAILIGASALLPTLSFWHTEAGTGMLNILFFMSFAMGLWHLINQKERPLSTVKQKTRMALLVVAVFLMYFVPAKLLLF